MFRMITLMWVMGVMLCAMPVQAGTLIREGYEPGARPDVTEWTKGTKRATQRAHAHRKVKGSSRYSRSAKSSRYSRYAKSSRHARWAKSSHRVARIHSRSAHRHVASGRKRVHVAQPHRRSPVRTAAMMGSLQTGIASFYGSPQRVASGGWFNPRAMTAAHRTLPFGTKVRVTHLSTGRSVDVTINDRGPYIGGRIIDLSTGAADRLGMRSAGLAKVKVEVLGR